MSQREDELRDQAAPIDPPENTKDKARLDAPAPIDPPENTESESES